MAKRFHFERSKTFFRVTQLGWVKLHRHSTSGSRSYSYVAVSGEEPVRHRMVPALNCILGWKFRAELVTEFRSRLARAASGDELEFGEEPEDTTEMCLCNMIFTSDHELQK